MPLEHMQTAGVLPRAERRQAGRALRKIVPRSLHGQWAQSIKRRDPVDLLVETGRHRIASLLPIRYDRMRASPFAFFRGAAAIMAAMNPDKARDLTAEMARSRTGHELPVTPVAGLKNNSAGG